MTAIRLKRYPSPSGGIALGKIGVGATIMSAAKTAKDYVQNGLVAMWDGIENAGWGIHDPSVTQWKDLAGNGYDLSLGLGSVFTANSLANTSYVEHGAAYLNSRNIPNVMQVEMCCNVTNKPSWALLFVNGAVNSTAPQNILIMSSTRGVQTSYTKLHKALVLTTGIYRISATWDALFYEGLRVTDTDFMSVDWNANNETALFGRPDTGYSAAGNIYSVRLYNRILTDAEVAANDSIDKERFNLP